jgi:colanic acid/amylovoran biosynthesis glycosyltransferase
MRIAVFVNEFPAIGEHALEARLRSLGRADCEVTVIAQQRPKHEAAPGAELAAVGVRYLANRADRGGVALLLERIAKAGAGRALRSLPALCRGNLDLFLAGTADLPPRDSFDVLHGYGRASAERCMFLKRAGLLRGKLVVSLGGDRDLRDRRFLRRLGRQSDRVLVPSEGQAAELRRRGCPPSKIASLRPGVDTASYSVKPKRLAPEEPLRLITAWTRDGDDGIADALRAFANLRQRRPVSKLHLDILGEGAGREALESLAKELGLTEIVAFHGVVPEAHARARLEQAQVFLLPLGAGVLDGAEAASFQILRAMASGLPVVSTWADVIPELVEHGATGYLAPLGNTEVLARYLELFLLHPERLPSMAAAGRERVSRELDATRHDARILDIYADLCGETFRRPPFPAIESVVDETADETVEIPQRPAPQPARSG